jgi:two-component system, cell cycle response regulator
LPITVSLGVALIESPSDSIDDIIKRADDALYRAKREGRNRVISNAA